MVKDISLKKIKLKDVEVDFQKEKQRINLQGGPLP